MTTVAAGHPVTARVLLTDHEDRVLLVQRAGRPDARWDLPGAVVETGESPSDAARRGVRDALGIDISLCPKDLFFVEWLAANTPVDGGQLAFVFAGPRLTTADRSRIMAQGGEPARSWAIPREAREMLHPRAAHHIRGRLRGPVPTLYRETRTGSTPA